MHARTGHYLAFRGFPCASYWRCCYCLVASVGVRSWCPTLRSYGLQPARLLCPWDSLGKSTRVGWHALLQRFFLTQGSNPGLLHCSLILYHWATREVLDLSFSSPQSFILFLKKKSSQVFCLLTIFVSILHFDSCISRAHFFLEG